jgi:hypothetical protein
MFIFVACSLTHTLILNLELVFAALGRDFIINSILCEIFFNSIKIVCVGSSFELF